MIANQILYREVDSKYPEWFNQEIQEKQQYQIGNKLTFQNN
jgi:hypothetical protein